MSSTDLHPRTDATGAPTQMQTLTVVALGLSLLCILWSIVEPRTVEGVAVWMKPVKFALSFVVLFATIALVEQRLSDAARQGWTYVIVGAVMATAFLAEMVYILYQAARAEASHFNFDTPFAEFMYTTVMAAGAVALVVCVAVIGWVVKRDKAADLSPALREAIWLGFLLSFVLTMIVAGYMSVIVARHVGIHPEGGPTIPFTGWSGVVGDFRPSHFVALHAMQVLPLLALWLDRRATAEAVRRVRIAAFAYAVLTLALFVQALMGVPLIPLA